jgi:SAM-dependent methyltransferase
MPGQNNFKPASGVDIRIDKNHYDFHFKTMGAYKDPASIYSFIKGASTNVAGEFDDVDEVDKEDNRDRRAELSLHAYASRFTTVCIFLELLATAGRSGTFKKCLDIGCGFGLQPRILRALGCVKEAVGIDIIDRTSALDPHALKQKHRQMKLFRFIEPYLERLDQRDKKELSNFQRALVEKIVTPRRQIKNTQGYLLQKDIYKKSFKHKAILDRFIEGNVYELDEKFDLITAYSSFEWFKADDALKKVSNLLEEGGIFYMYIAQWWASNNCCKIPGHFPYARQRLQSDDFDHYASTFHSDFAEQTKAAYGFYDPSHPTYSDYVRLGMKHGLVPVAHLCTGQPDHYSHKFGMHAKGYACDSHPEFMEALTDIQRFRPDVKAEDIMTDLVHIVFQKVDTKKTASKEYYDNALDEVSFSYRPKNPILKFIRKLGVHFLLGSKS